MIRQVLRYVWRLGLLQTVFTMCLKVARRLSPAALVAFRRTYQKHHRVVFRLSELSIRRRQENRLFRDFLMVTRQGEPADTWRLSRFNLAHLEVNAAKRPPFHVGVRKALVELAAAGREAEIQFPDGPAIITFAHQSATRSATDWYFRRVGRPVIGAMLTSRRGLPRDQAMATANAAMGRHLIQARRELAAGGLVAILGDGQKGRFGTPADICGRRIFLQPGFATLAIMQDVPVYFCRADIREDGQLDLVFSDGFHPKAEGRDNATMVNLYLDWYAEHLRAIYLQHPETLLRSRIEKFMAAPQTRPAPEDVEHPVSRSQLGSAKVAEWLEGV
ncbi:hypothetical protein OZN62_05090 [Aurantiacibacter sp. MUD11]|uniref:hypothetical protein n=1 Tax=Aurantiacibacter sp. MUD11 TaxID=3003265 RepID=UPI0022AB0208|nr:hypothetical protein [Aurantiacibacter sp. MUD11]WAT18948.1 hypothetical protein OZN62_05090 [Aurantiacibacter sp. MUD11]